MDVKRPVEAIPRKLVARGHRRCSACIGSDTETPASSADTGAGDRNVATFSEGSGPITTINGSLVDVRFALFVLMLIRLTLFGRQRLLGET